MESRYGKPGLEQTSFEMEDPDWQILRQSQVDGRSHDVTMFVFHQECLAVIAKHAYPPDLYRAPSGGVHPGESMEQGVLREMMEETGLTIEIKRYLLRVEADFTHGEEIVHWMTHVFEGGYLSGEIAPQDTKEIREACWLPEPELQRIEARLHASPSAGLRYRGRLHALVMQRWNQTELP